MSKPISDRAKPAKSEKPAQTAEVNGKERIAKRLARAGLCSRREAETWIAAGRVAVNGKVLETPAFTVGLDDKIEVDGAPLPAAERTRLWLYHKPPGLVTTARDPEGRPTVFGSLPKDMPRVLSIGRLDINTEGLLLLTNDGGLARVLELPKTGWLRRYRVRAHGEVSQEQLDALKDGMAVDGVLYGSMEALLDRRQGSNVWITLALREGKNREVKNVLGALGLSVNRLIRVSFGPFQLGDLAEGEVREIRGRMLRDQLGPRLAAEAGANFDTPPVQLAPQKLPEAKPDTAKKPGKKPEFKREDGRIGGSRRVPRGQAAEDALDRMDTRRKSSPSGGKSSLACGRPERSSKSGDGPKSGGGKPGGGLPTGQGRGNADRRR